VIVQTEIQTFLVFITMKKKILKIAGIVLGINVDRTDTQMLKSSFSSFFQR